MIRTQLYAALLLSLATPVAFAQQASEPKHEDTRPIDAKDDCRVVDSAEPDTNGVYRAVLECTRSPATAATDAAATAVAALKPPDGGPSPVPDTDGLDYFTSNGPAGDGTDQSVAGEYSIAAGPYASALGQMAVAFGWGAHADGNWSVAIGRDSQSGNRDIAIGHMAVANGNGAVAIGAAVPYVAGWHNTQATGSMATAVGTGSIASGQFSTALGFGAVAYGDDATAVGEGAVARAELSSALGVGAEAFSVAGSAFGVKALALGELSSAFGAWSSAMGNYSSAFGNDSWAGADYANAFGSFSEAAGFASTAIGVGAVAVSANSTTLGGAYFIGATDDGSDWTGDIVRSLAQGQGATSVGAGAQALADQAMAAGTLSQALGVDSLAVGALSLAEADASTAIGSYSSALGIGSTASGYGAIARGENSVASGLGAAAIGDNSVALGANSVAERANTVSIGAEGAERQLTNVADGTEDFDAVNLRQLRAAGLVDDTGTTLHAVTYDSATEERISFGGAGGTTLANVHAGAIGANSLDAINGAQMFAMGQGFAAIVGGGMTYNGAFSAPTFDVMGGAFGNVGDALAALDAGIASLETRVTTVEQHAPSGSGGQDPHVDVDGGNAGNDNAHAGSGTGAIAVGASANASGTGSVAVGANTQATGANSIALGTGSVADRANTVSVGAQGHERQVTNVAAGTADTDAANVGQMNAADARTLADARAYTDMRFGELVAAPLQAVSDLRNEVNKRFDDTDKRIDQMGAMNSAMLNMATSAAGLNQVNRVGVGVGFSGGQSALSLGYQRLINEHTTITFGGAFSSDDASAGAGIGIGW